MFGLSVKVKMNYIFYYIVIIAFLVGCSVKDNTNIKKYDVDCDDCKVRILYDIDKSNTEVQKGFF